MSKFNIGDKVRYINTVHDTNPNYYPPYGTIGVFKGNNWVQWPAETTSGDGYWCCDESDIELVVDEKKTIDTHMTNEEIWEMLKPKMEKNGLVSKDVQQNVLFYIRTYYERDVHNAIAIAYRSGYERAMKGRPFKIGEKKKKKGGHWEPIDPDNLPKEGTRVRYSRADIDHNDSYIKLYDTGEVEYKSNTFYKEFGMKLDKERRKGCGWVFFGGSEDSLDMWVEDDE